ncbi:MAG: hypothetical protein GC178_15500 [Flavobacteriales bacterium]|nr:hypothetical protein [Flavobacteriales bacterium]
MSETILDDDQFEGSYQRRRDLLPVWIKFFIWVFMVFGVLSPFGLILGAMGTSFSLSLYGIETPQPISVLGFLLTSLFALKGVVGFGLWTERDWAVQLAIIDAVIGIAICAVVTVVLPFLNSHGFEFNFRLELFFLIPYFLKMKKIQKEWNERVD